VFQIAVSALKTVYEMNVKNYHGGRLGAGLVFIVASFFF
jgi:hypothetical protein